MKFLLAYSFRKMFFIGQNLKCVQVTYYFDEKISSAAEWQEYHSVYSGKTVKSKHEFLNVKENKYQQIKKAIC